MLEDPIGGDENDTENIDSMTEGADEELCIIPDTQRVLSQAEKITACNLSSLKDISTSTLEEGESSQSTEIEETTFTIIKYKDENPQTCCKCGWVSIYLKKFFLTSNLDFA